MSAREKRLPVHFSHRLDAETIEDGNRLPRVSGGVPSGTLEKLMHPGRATEGPYRLPAEFVFELVENRFPVYFFLSRASLDAPRGVEIRVGSVVRIVS